MKRTLYFAALALALVLVAGPVIGDPGEPTAPVTDVTLNLSHYGTHVQLVCMTSVGGLTWNQLLASNADRFSSGKMRIEAFVNVAALPSEHWDTRIMFDRVIRGNGGTVTFKEDSYYDWRHQNVPVSGRRNWELTQSAKQFTGLNGWWRITANVTGLESGNHYAPSCVFEVVSP